VKYGWESSAFKSEQTQQEAFSTRQSPLPPSVRRFFGSGAEPCTPYEAQRHAPTSSLPGVLATRTKSHSLSSTSPPDALRTPRRTLQSDWNATAEPENVKDHGGHSGQA
jgi:hypothetical protein